MQKNQLKNQRGMSFIGIVIVAAFLISILLVGVKLTPHYIEYFGVKKIVQKIGNESNFDSMSKKEIADMFDKGATVGYVKVIRGADLTIGKDANGKQVVTAEYQVVEPLGFNLSALMDFKASSGK